MAEPSTAAPARFSTPGTAGWRSWKLPPAATWKPWYAGLASAEANVPDAGRHGHQAARRPGHRDRVQRLPSASRFGPLRPKLMPPGPVAVAPMARIASPLSTQ